MIHNQLVSQDVRRDWYVAGKTFKPEEVEVGMILTGSTGYLRVVHDIIPPSETNWPDDMVLVNVSNRRVRTDRHSVSRSYRDVSGQFYEWVKSK